MDNRKGLGRLSAWLGLVLVISLWAVPDTATAIDFKISGQWQILFEYSNVLPRGVNGADRFGALQRFRTQLEAVASENLSGSVQISIGRTEWGQAKTGGALGSDGHEVKLRHAYLDWRIPQTAVQVRMGIQQLYLPGFLAMTSAVFAQDMAGISVNAPLWENDTSSASLSGFWARPYNDNSENYFHNSDTQHLDNLDVFALSLPMKWEKFRFIPWAMYTLIGKYSLSGLQVTTAPALVAPRGGLTPVFGGANNYVTFQDSRLRSLDRPWGTASGSGSMPRRGSRTILTFRLKAPSARWIWAAWPITRVLAILRGVASTCAAKAGSPGQSWNTTRSGVCQACSPGTVPAMTTTPITARSGFRSSTHPGW